MKQENQSFWKNGLSVDETRFSVLVLAFTVGYIVFMYLCVKNNDIDAVERIILFLGSAITGLNIAKAVAENKNTPKG